MSALAKSNLSQFGDAWEHMSWYVKFCWEGGSGRFGLLRRAHRLAPWWAKDRIVSARYRPDGAGANEYDDGVLTVFYARPGQTLGPYQSRSARLQSGEYFRL